MLQRSEESFLKRRLVVQAVNQSVSLLFFHRSGLSDFDFTVVKAFDDGKRFYMDALAAQLVTTMLEGFLYDESHAHQFRAKKKKPSTMENMLVTSVYSFTKQRSYDVCVSKDFLAPGDQVLFIDDFLANGNAAKLHADGFHQYRVHLVIDKVIHFQYTSRIAFSVFENTVF